MKTTTVYATLEQGVIEPKIALDFIESVDTKRVAAEVVNTLSAHARENLYKALRQAFSGASDEDKIAIALFDIASDMHPKQPLAKRYAKQSLYALAEREALVTFRSELGDNYDDFIIFTTAINALDEMDIVLITAISFAYSSGITSTEFYGVYVRGCKHFNEKPVCSIVDFKDVLKNEVGIDDPNW